LQHFCREAIRHFRNLLVARVCGAESELVQAPKDERARIAEQAARFTEEDLTRFFNTLMNTDAELRRAPDPRLHLELGLLKMINAKRLAPLEEVLANLREGAVSRPAPASAGGGSNPLAKSFSASAPGTQGMGAVPGSGGTRAVSSSSGAAAKMAPVTAFKSEPKASSLPTTENSPASATINTSPKPASESRWSVPFPGSADVAKHLKSQSAPVEINAEPTVTIPVVNRASNAVTLAEAAPAPIAAPVTAPTIAPAVAPIAAASVAPATPSAASAGKVALTPEQIEKIRALLVGSKFLLSMLDEVTSWEMGNGEMQLFFHPDSRSLSEMLQAKDPMERLRNALAQVLGQPLRVCVKLDASRAAPAAPNSELKARFEQDPIVRAMLEKFGGQISNVKRPGGN
jgi:DNA polymerase III gamma/tau subunit